VIPFVIRPWSAIRDPRSPIGDATTTIVIAMPYSAPALAPRRKLRAGF